MAAVDAQKLLDAIADEIRGHVPCGFPICEQATNLVPGEGSATAPVVIVGEAPGASEDAQGRHLPFLDAQLAIADVHGHVLRRDERALFPLYHPAAALHNPRLRPTLLDDARALREAL